MKKTHEAQQKATRKRAIITPEKKANAYKYYLMGLKKGDISTLLGVAVRTIEHWQSLEKWTQATKVEPLSGKVTEVHKTGLSYEEIGEKIGVSKSTAYRHAKKARMVTA